MNPLRLGLALLLLASLAGCVNQSVKSTSVPAVVTAPANVPEDLLLDVGIVVFDPGIDELEEQADDEPRIYPEVRRAESLHIPNQLAASMQDSGAWGAIRVLPNEDQITDLLITGQILRSDGETLEIAVKAIDSRGFVWLDETYEGSASRYAYKVTSQSGHDPFQAVYNTAANDLLEVLEQLEHDDRRDVRLVTELLFARSFSPDAFDGYLAKNPKDKYLVMRLPAEDDPMLARVRTIRERDHLFVDTLQEYYVSFDEQMAGPYDEWRKLSYEEVVALEELRAESRRQMLAGAVAVIGGIAAATTGDSSTTRAAGNIAVIGGGYLFKSGLLKRSEAQIHVEALEELGTSLEAEIAPKVIELEDRTVTLSGNVEEQYAQWRALLAEIYAAEVGMLEPPAGNVTPTDTL